MWTGFDIFALLTFVRMRVRTAEFMLLRVWTLWAVDGF